MVNKDVYNYDDESEW